MKIQRFRFAACVAWLALLAACENSPSGSSDSMPDDTNTPGMPDPSSDTPIRLAPALHIIRDDTESWILEKPFAGPASTSFPEQLSGISINVSTTPDADCPADAIECETWSLSTNTALAAKWQIEAFRGLVDRNYAQGNLYVVPTNAASAPVSSIVGSSISGSRPTFTVRTSDATLHVLGFSPLLNVAGRGDVDFFGGEFVQPSDRTQTDIALAADVNNRYGVAARTDGSLLEWFAGTASIEGFGPRSFDSLSGLIQSLGTSVTAWALPVSRVLITPTGTPTEPEGIGAALLASGQVAVWDRFDSGNLASLFPSEPILLENVDNAIAISMEERYLTIVTADGQVLEYGSPNRLALSDSLYAEATPIGGITNAIDVNGRLARLADGRVMQWQPTLGATGSVPRFIPGVTDAVALPDRRSNMARLANGALVGWSFTDDASAPGLPYLIDVSAIGNPRFIQSPYVADDVCGRLFFTNLLSHAEQGPAGAGTFVVNAEPIPNLAGGADCNQGERSSLVYFYVTGTGSGEIVPPNGNVECANREFGQLCWWFGQPNQSPQFLAVPDSDSTFRDWRWDCASGDAQSIPVLLRRADRGNAENICKLTFVAGSDDSQPMPPSDPPPPVGNLTLRVIVNGAGTVDVAPLGLRLPDDNCDGNECYVTDIASGTTLVLTAAAQTPAAFSGWSTQECDAIPDPDTCEIILTTERSVTADFQ